MQPAQQMSAAMDPAQQQAMLQQQQAMLQQQMLQQQMLQQQQLQQQAMQPGSQGQVQPMDPQQQALMQQQLQQQQAMLQQQLQQQQLMQQQGTVNMLGGSGVAQPMQPGTAASQNLQVTIRRSGFATLGFTPFKWSVNEAMERRVGGFDFKELLDKVDFAKEQGGLPVQAVEANGAAAQAGLQAWDVILGVNNSDIRTLSGEQAITFIKQLPQGQDVVLLVLRSNTPPPAPGGTRPPPPV